MTTLSAFAQARWANAKAWAYQLFIAIDQLLNVLITPLQAGAYADETMSSRAYRMHRDGRPWGRVLMPVIDLLFRWQIAEHCRHAYIKEQARLQLPPEFRDQRPQQ